MQDNMQRSNIRINGIPEGEEQEEGIENLFEKISPKSRKHRESQERGTQTDPLEDTS